MFGGLCKISRVSEQGKEQADTGHYKRKVRLILNIQEYFQTHNICTCVWYSYTGIKGFYQLDTEDTGGLFLMDMVKLGNFIQTLLTQKGFNFGSMEVLAVDKIQTVFRVKMDSHEKI